MKGRALPLAKRRTKAELERSALNLLDQFCPECLIRPSPVPIREILEFHLEESYGIPFFIAQLPPDHEAATRPARGHLPIRIEMQQHIYDRLYLDEGRARFTAGHEICHALHHMTEIDLDLVDGQVFGLYRETTIPREQNPERQADVFSAHLLMPTEMVRLALNSIRNPDAHFVADTFRVSLTAAKVRMREIGFR